MIPSLIEIKILVKRPIFRTLGYKGLKRSINSAIAIIEMSLKYFIFGFHASKI